MIPRYGRGTSKMTRGKGPAMRRKKRPDLLVIIALFVGFGLIATALSQEFTKDAPNVISLDQTHAANVDTRNR